MLSDDKVYSPLFSKLCNYHISTYLPITVYQDVWIVARIVYPVIPITPKSSTDIWKLLARLPSGPAVLSDALDWAVIRHGELQTSSNFLLDYMAVRQPQSPQRSSFNSTAIFTSAFAPLTSVACEFSSPDSTAWQFCMSSVPAVELSQEAWSLGCHIHRAGWTVFIQSSRISSDLLPGFQTFFKVNTSFCFFNFS